MSVASVDQFGLNGAGNNAFQTPEHEGWLHKQGDRYKTWNKRWFVLKGPNLFYFKSPKVNSWNNNTMNRMDSTRTFSYRT